MNELDSSFENLEKKNLNKNYFELSNDTENDNNNLIKEEDEENINNENNDEEDDDDEGVLFERCFDCNYFWINNIVRDEQKIINFIKNHTKFKDDNIENLNLNTV